MTQERYNLHTQSGDVFLDWTNVKIFFTISHYISLRVLSFVYKLGTDTEEIGYERSSGPKQ